MTQQKKQGMHLRQTENPRKKNTFWLLQTLVAVLAGVVLILTTGNLVGITGSTLAVMAAVGAYLCIMYGLLLRVKKPHWFFYLALILLLILALVCRNQVLEGYRLFWSRMSDAKVRGTGWLLPEWELQLPEEKSGLCLTLFAMLLSGGTSLLVCFLTAWAPGLLAAMLPGAALFAMAFFGTELSFAWLLVILAASVLILMYSGWGSRNALAPVTMSWFTGIIAAAVLILVVSLPGIRSWTDRVGEQMQETIHSRKYETEHTTLP